MSRVKFEHPSFDYPGARYTRYYMVLSKTTKSLIKKVSHSPLHAFSVLVSSHSMLKVL